jgi:signal peptidase II
MPERTYRVLLWSLALTGLLVDQVSKYGVFSWLYDVPESKLYALFQVEPSTRYFSIVSRDVDSVGRVRNRGFFLEVAFESAPDAAGRPVPHVNHGALFGFLRDYETAANRGFALISLLAAAAIIFWSSQKSTAKDRWLCAALGLILAGTLGNFYDRMLFNGVRDFLHWNYYFDWPVFNLADCCLVTGACLLLVQAFLLPHPTAQQTEAEAVQKPIDAALTGVACSAGSTSEV